MVSLLENSKIAIVGGGEFCLELLQTLFRETQWTRRPEVIGVADINEKAVGFLFAKEKGIFTTTDYHDLYTLPGLTIIAELTHNDILAEKINRDRPNGVQVLDHFEARSILDRIRTESKRNEIVQLLRRTEVDAASAESLFDQYYEFMLEICEKRDAYSQKVRKGLIAGEKALSQIIQGMTIPTFVIDQDHTVTHWNKACEKLTGFSANELVGTNNHWKAFRKEKRPIMADLILDGVSEEEVWRYYSTKWKKSELIEDAFEAEEYFEHLGEGGKWLYFNAAPIKSKDGTIIGAIETLWDRTEEKKAEEILESHNLQLALKAKELKANQKTMEQIIEGSTIPTFVINNDHVLTHWNKAMEKLTGYSAEKMVGTRKQWEPFWDNERPSMADVILDQISPRKIRELYGTKWRKSVMIEDAYEAEVFFPKLGDNGKWCFFTAAPIKSAEGKIIAAIETLWDKTEEKKAEDERNRHNKRLVESERALSQIVQGSTIPTFVINRDHVVTHWNRACEKLTGYPAEEIVGTNHQWRPFRSKERPTIADLILDGVKIEELWRYYGTKWKESDLIEDAYEVEEYFQHLGPKGKWLYFTASPIKSPDGDITGAIETLWDKTEERKAEEAQEKHTRELATLCSIYATLSASLDIHGRINAVIQDIKNIFSFDCVCIFMLEKGDKFDLKYTCGSADCRCEEQKTDNEDRIISQIAETGQLIVVDNISNKDDTGMTGLNEVRFQTLAYVPLFDKMKKTIGFIRAASKEAIPILTEEKRVLELIGNRMGVAIENAVLQEEVRRQANFQIKMINSSNNGIVATDKNWDIVIFNPEAERLYGIKKPDIVGNISGRELLPFEVIKSIEKKRDSEALRSDISWQETHIRSHGGDMIPVSFSGSPLFQNDKMMGSVVFFQDLREIKRLEKELVHSERLAAIGQTVAGMAHGIKNILNGFKGGRYLVDIGIDKENPDKLKQGWEMIKRNIDRTSELVLDLLSYSKEREPEYQNCIPNNIVEDVCQVVKAAADEHEIEIVKDLSPQLGEVLMDPKTIHNCLLNLASNALDACIFDDTINKKHTVKFKTSIENHLIRFEVTDNGAGMTDEVKSKLFTSFFSTKGPKGTGLGLLVTKKLIEEHEGTVDVTSRLHEGTTFVVTLPFKEAAKE
jgi:PAS domain S-box-containing protein